MNTNNTHSEEAFEKLEPRTWLGDVNRAAWDRLVEIRGGCSCRLSPPCHNCTEPPTEEELNRFAYTYGEGMLADGIADEWEEGREV